MLDEFDLDLLLGELRTPTATADRPAQEGALAWEIGAVAGVAQPLETIASAVRLIRLSSMLQP
jgi:hypothetical protein